MNDRLEIMSRLGAGCMWGSDESKFEVKAAQLLKIAEAIIYADRCATILRIADMESSTRGRVSKMVTPGTKVITTKDGPTFRKGSTGVLSRMTESGAAVVKMDFGWVDRTFENPQEELDLV